MPFWEVAGLALGLAAMVGIWRAGKAAEAELALRQRPTLDRNGELLEPIPPGFPLEFLPLVPGGRVVASASRRDGERTIGLELPTADMGRVRQFYAMQLQSELSPGDASFRLSTSGKSGDHPGIDGAGRDDAGVACWVAQAVTSDWRLEARVMERPDAPVSFAILTAQPRISA